MKAKDDTSATRSFFNMLEWPSALGLGSVAAFLYSLKQINPRLHIVIDVWSWIILVAGTLIAWRVTRSVFRAGTEQLQDPAALNSEQRLARQKHRIKLFCLIVGPCLLASLVYALKDIPASKRWDVAIGVSSALIFVTIALYLFWRLVQFLERHGHPDDENQEDSQDHHPNSR